MQILSFSFLAILVFSICQFVIETSGENSDNFLKHLKDNIRNKESKAAGNVEKENNEDKTQQYRHDLTIKTKHSSQNSNEISNSQNDIQADENQYHRKKQNVNYGRKHSEGRMFTQILEANNPATEDDILISRFTDSPNNASSDVSTEEPSTQFSEIQHIQNVVHVQAYEPQINTTSLGQTSAAAEANSQEFKHDGEQQDDAEMWNNTINDTENGSSSDCPTCGKNGLTEEDVKLIRVEMFKELLANKLRIVSQTAPMEGYQSDMVPRDQLPKLPQSILEQTFKDNEEEIKKEEFYAKDDEVIIPGEDMEGDCIKGHSLGCFSFSLSNKIKWDVVEAKLWIYKTKDLKDRRLQMFTVTELKRLKRGNLAMTSPVASEGTSIRQGWVTLNLTQSLIKWVSSKTDKQILAIQCATCNTKNYTKLFKVEEYKPLLVVKYGKSNQIVRTKRSNLCDPRYGCCVRDLTIRFHDIGMIEVYQPSNLSIGYCYGNCNEMHHITYNHTMLVQKQRYSSTVGSHDPMFEQLKPCCVPTMLKDMFLITLSEGNLVRKLVPKVIVEMCGCV